MREMKSFVVVVTFFAVVLSVITLNPLGMGEVLVATIGRLLMAFVESPFFMIAMLAAGIAILVGSIFR